jgi:hypothetical protein
VVGGERIVRLGGMKEKSRGFRKTLKRIQENLKKTLRYLKDSQIIPEKPRRSSRESKGDTQENPERSSVKSQTKLTNSLACSTAK